MNCDVCSIGDRQPKLIRYSLPTTEGLILIDHVPAEVCDRCGEVTLTPDVVERLLRSVWQQEPPSRVIETPVYEFA